MVTVGWFVEVLDELVSVVVTIVVDCVLPVRVVDMSLRVVVG